MRSHLLFAALLLAISFIGCAQASVTPITPTPTPTPTPSIPEFPAYSLLIAASSMIVLAFVISRRGGRNKQRA